MVKTVEPPLRPGRVPGSNMLKTLAEDLEIGELLDHDGQVACLLTVTTYNATWSLLVDDIRAKLLTGSKPRHTYKQTQAIHLGTTTADFVSCKRYQWRERSQEGEILNKIYI